MTPIFGGDEHQGESLREKLVLPAERTLSMFSCGFRGN